MIGDCYGDDLIPRPHVRPAPHNDYPTFGRRTQFLHYCAAQIDDLPKQLPHGNTLTVSDARNEQASPRRWLQIAIDVASTNDPNRRPRVSRQTRYHFDCR